MEVETRVGVICEKMYRLIIHYEKAYFPKIFLFDGNKSSKISFAIYGTLSFGCPAV